MEEELETEIARLREKLQIINQREVTALSILAFPIDDLSVEERLAEEAEKRLAKAKGRLKKELNEGSLSSLFETVRTIELKNETRRRDIENYSSTLRLTRTKLTESVRSSPPSPRSISRKQSSLVSEDNSEALDYINSVFSSLQEKKKAVQRQEAATNAYEEEMKEKRRYCENELNAKMTRIERLSQTIRNKGYISMDIQRANELILKLSESYEELRAEKARLKRRISNTAKDTYHNKELKTMIADASRVLSEKETSVISQSETLKEKHERIMRLANEVDKLDHKVRLYEQKVAENEEEVQKLEIDHSSLVSQLQVEASNLSSSLMTYSNIFS